MPKYASSSHPPVQQRFIVPKPWALNTYSTLRYGGANTVIAYVTFAMMSRMFINTSITVGALIMRC